MQIEGFTDVSLILKGGVYILVFRGEVVYVGKAKRMLNRVQAHLSVWAAKRKEKVPDWLPIKGIYYDTVLIRPCHPDEIDAIERQFIDLYKPKFNIALKSPGPTRAPFTIEIGNVSLPINHRPSGLPEITRRL